MSAYCCEKCWGDAYYMARVTGRPQHECYTLLLKQRDKEGRICTPREQAGQWWDEERQCDSRNGGHKA